MVDYTAVITALIGLAGGGALSYVFFFRQEKRKADATADKMVKEVDITEAEADEKKLANEISLALQWKALYEDQRNENKEINQKIDKLESFHERRYQSLERQYNDVLKISDDNKLEIQDLKQKAEKNKIFICYDLACKVRKRKQTDAGSNQSKAL